MILTREEQKILETDYSAGSIDREAAMKIAYLCRDYRLFCGLFRTEQEQRDYIEKGLALKLPGQR